MVFYFAKVKYPDEGEVRRLIFFKITDISNSVEFCQSGKSDRIRPMGFSKELISRRNFLKLAAASAVGLASGKFLAYEREGEAYFEPEVWHPNFDQIKETQIQPSSQSFSGLDGKYQVGVPGVVKMGEREPGQLKRPEWPREILAQPVRKVKTSRPEIALTFDDGYGYTSDILDILERTENDDVCISTFLIGSVIQKNPEFARRVVADGYEIANHGATHHTLTTLSDEGLRQEILGDEQIVQSVCGQTTKPYLRPSGGTYGQREVDVAADLGFRLILWSVDPQDWKLGADPQYWDRDAKWLEDYIIPNTYPGDIVIFHYSRYSTVLALQPILDGLRGRGLKIVSLTQLFT